MASEELQMMRRNYDWHDHSVKAALALGWTRYHLGVRSACHIYVHDIKHTVVQRVL